MAWIVHGSAVLGSVLRFPAPGAGLGVGPDLGCAGVGDFLCCCVSFARQSAGGVLGGS
jgi:hypothetical protein